ncbi:hypothetical protein KIK84_09920 [Curvibacter sp. CHRR-16]|uniref:hypothetical protein n=1 Tax=Curvibacter sp. CHRR-16 TaxID=2835872 RepID=UPI001BDB00F6|nr:hypothetical protein [Curvibacter sp. CHRR-16]MBT0570645.1 hypothetical protein [Curvibacter sp. CHRR-16]
MKAWPLLLAGLLVCACASAQADDETALHRERTQLEQQWRAEMDVCAQRFAVTHCQTLATERYNAQDRVLANRLLDLHRQQRMQRAQDKRNELEQREEEFQQELLKRSQSKLGDIPNANARNALVQAEVKRLLVSANPDRQLSIEQQARAAYERKMAEVQQRRVARDKRLADVGGDLQLLPTP